MLQDSMPKGSGSLVHRALCPSQQRLQIRSFASPFWSASFDASTYALASVTIQLHQSLSSLHQQYHYGSLAQEHSRKTCGSWDFNLKPGPTGYTLTHYHRNISSTSTRWARPSMAPSTRGAKIPMRKGDILPPLQLVESAFKAGTLKTPPKRVIEFITAFLDLNPTTPISRIEKLCKGLSCFCLQMFS